MYTNNIAADNARKTITTQNMNFTTNESELFCA